MRMGQVVGGMRLHGKLKRIGIVQWLGAQELDIRKFTMHDLRRTAATCAETWAACHTGGIAYCLDHQDNRDNTAPRLSQHIPQKPAVLQMWKAELLHIIGDETAAPTRVPSKRLLKLVA
jgi:integrase